MCGGYRGGLGRTNKCYVLDLLTNVWRQTGIMTETKILTGYSVHPRLGLVITGGHDGHGGSSRAESTMDGSSFRRHASIPTGSYCHCQVRQSIESNVQ